MPQKPSISEELDLRPGREIKDYILDRELDEGGMGVVWVASHKYLQRSTALKFIRKTRKQHWIERFQQEAIALSRVKHQNVVTVYEAGPWGYDAQNRPMFFIAMELLAGRTLDQELPADLRSTIELCLQITQGLVAIHHEGIKHRDLKPQNIFLEQTSGLPGQPEKMAKIGDFGIAQLPDAPFGVSTTIGTFLGTYVYASPEQIVDASTVDERSDLYSLGLIFWQLFAHTRELPSRYDEAETTEDLIAAKQIVPDPPSILNPTWNIPPQLDELVQKLLQRDPANRYQTAMEVYKALTAIKTSLTQSPITTVAPTADIASVAPTSTQTNFYTTPGTRSGDLVATDIMRARQVDAVRTLFAKLGYPVSQEPFDINPGDWYASSRDAIEEAYWIVDYNLAVDAFSVVLFELNNLSAATLQSISKDLLRRAGNWLFVAVKPVPKSTGESIYDRLLFILPQRGPTPDRPRLLRLAVDTARPTRHTLDVLRAMTLSEPLPSPSEIYLRLLDAFNVEAITRRFYKQYADIHNRLVDKVRVSNIHIAALNDPQEAGAFVQRLLGRLMFLYFVQKKGWLAGDEAFLTTQFGIVDGRNDNYYRQFLVPLFFRALALPESERNQNPASGPVWSQQEIPFLNGGLFEVGVGQEYELELGLQFDNALFAPDDRGPFDLGNGETGGILAFFNRFEFTVEEDTPEDIAVSLDPEMLGKVFEELITGRHETGSYYTPRPVVAFMCREALKGYLRAQLADDLITTDQINALIDEDSAANFSQRAKIQMLRVLADITVCDPACGSGAYLLVMLHELLRIRQRLLSDDTSSDRDIYNEKLDIIQRNLYGVDSDPIAVGIARLRLWLSLIVDFDGPNPPPLPNLDYKIMIGDSLVETVNGERLYEEIPEDGTASQSDYISKLNAERAALQAEFQKLRQQLFDFNGTGEQRREIKERLLEIERELVLTVLREQRGALDERERDITVRTDWKIPAREKKYTRELAAIQGQRSVIDEIERQVKKEQRRPVFPWRMYFSEVFHNDGGFDVILANPPYVRADAQFRHLSDNEPARQEAIKRWHEYRAMLMDSGMYETLYEKWDLYIPFLERAFKLMRDHGQMAFIIPDAYNAAKYTLKSHEFFLKKSRVVRLDFCSDIPLFEGVGVANTILHSAKTAPQPGDETIRVRRWGKETKDFDINQEPLPTLRQLEVKVVIFKSGERTVHRNTKNLVSLNEICYLSWGLRPNSDERFYRGAFKTKDVLSNVQDKLHPKPCIQGKDTVKWWAYRIRYIEWNTSRAPGMFARPTFPEMYNTPEKLLIMKVSGVNPRVIYDDRKLICTDAFCCCVPWHYLEGVRNRSIRDTARYNDEFRSPRDREKYYERERVEALSEQFRVKYLIAIMNSSFAKAWLLPHRRHKIQLYPEDWKSFPIAVIPLIDQQPLIDLVDKILAEYTTHGYPLPEDAAARVAGWEQEIDAQVYAIYGITPDKVDSIATVAPTDVGDDDALDDE